jgi:hypothetical protein
MIAICLIFVLIETLKIAYIVGESIEQENNNNNKK